MSDKEEQEPTAAEVDEAAAETTPPATTTPTPEPHAALGEEVQQLHQLWREYGQQTLAAVAVALVLAAAWTWYRNHREAADREAQQALFRARGIPELQSYVERYPGRPTTPLAALMLAHAQFAASKHTDALALYESLIKDYPKHDLLPVAQMGRAHALEALGRFQDAIADFDAFLAAHKDHYLAPEAHFGKARCLQQLNRLDEARVIYEDFIAANPESDQKPRAEEWLKRVEKAIRNGGWKPAVSPAMPTLAAPEALSLPPVPPAVTNKP